MMNFLKAGEKKKAVNVIRDKVYKWKGKNFSILILENQLKRERVRKRKNYQGKV